MNNKIYRIIINVFSVLFLITTITNFHKSSGATDGLAYYFFYIAVTLYIIDIFIILLITNFNIQKVLPDFILIIILFFLINYKSISEFFVSGKISISIAVVAIILRNIYNIINKNENIEIKDLSHNILRNPAKSVISSYFIITFIGTSLLTLPFAINGSDKLGYINALFTSTSAICVTGLNVVDTGTIFTLFGQITILILIQLGGLGIMIFSTFISFMLYRKISIEDTITLSYVLNQKDMSSLFRNIKNIILTAFIIESIGTFFLFIKFQTIYGFSFKSLYYSIFHSVSAFCNAGFALMPDSLMSYKSSPVTIFTIAFLIIAGGLGFSTISNVYHYLGYKIKKINKNYAGTIIKLSDNTKIVLITSSILTIISCFMIYALEHNNTLAKENIGTQYLSSFFQAVTLRTAGFNTMDTSLFHSSTYLFMMIMMYIGGASGSTAGGVKVNTLAIIVIRIRAFMRNQETTIAFNKTISRDIIVRCFMILFLSISLIITALFILTISDSKQNFIKLAFETISAFGTVGLSGGITADLSSLGKLVIIILMFIGKTGPLTLFSAVANHKKSVKIQYPSADVMIG